MRWQRILRPALGLFALAFAIWVGVSIRGRKPLPGLLEQIGARFGVALRDVPVVGDSLRDLQAGAAVGCKPHFVQTGKAGRLDAAELAAVQSAVPEAKIHADLAAFVHELLHAERIERGDAAEPDSVFGTL